MFVKLYSLAWDEMYQIEIPQYTAEDAQMEGCEASETRFPDIPLRPRSILRANLIRAAEQTKR